METMAVEAKKAKIDWKGKSVEKFGLLPARKEAWTGDDSRETWKAYYEHRLATKKTFDANYCVEDENDCDDDYHETKPLWEKTKKGLKKEARSTSLGNDWLRSAYFFADSASWEEYEYELQSAEYSAFVYSPYAIPTTIRLEHRIHQRSRCNSVEFHVTFCFELLRFDGTPVDHKASAYDKRYKLETLCSNSLMDVPYPEDLWRSIENIDVENFNPHTVARLRKWLLGNLPEKQLPIPSLDFLRLLTATMGAPNFKPLYIDIGYTWREPYDLKQNGEDYCYTSVNWFEYQARLASSALRPIDMDYQPYDLDKAKREYGREIINMSDDQKTSYRRKLRKLRKQQNGKDDELGGDKADDPMDVWSEVAENPGSLQEFLATLMH